VQGKVLFNSKPVANIEVKLCEKSTDSRGFVRENLYGAHRQ